MATSSFLLYALVLLASTGAAGTARRGIGHCETLPAGAKTISSKYFSDFTVVRQLTLIRGDSSSHGLW